MITIKTTGSELVNGTLERRLNGLPLDAEYQEIRIIFANGTTDAKSRRSSTVTRTARNAFQSFFHGGGANARRRDEIRRQGSAVIEIYFKEKERR